MRDDLLIHVDDIIAGYIPGVDILNGCSLELTQGEIIGIIEMFVLASASNVRQVKTIVDEVEQAIKDSDGANPRSVEGLGDASWVLMDYGDIVVHVFLDETRAFYDLDRLWSDVPRTVFDDVPEVQPAT